MDYKYLYEITEEQRKEWASLVIKKQLIIEAMLPGGWIELKQGNPLPDYDEPALWLSEDGNMHVDSLDKDGNPWIFEGYKLLESGPTIKTTHWRSLPTRPNETSTKEDRIFSVEDVYEILRQVMFGGTPDLYDQGGLHYNHTLPADHSFRRAKESFEKYYLKQQK